MSSNAMLRFRPAFYVATAEALFCKREPHNVTQTSSKETGRIIFRQNDHEIILP